jgi:hypothetical protein
MRYHIYCTKSAGKCAEFNQMSRRATKPPAGLKNARSDSSSDVQEFLVRELPPKNTRRASYFADAVREAGERYDRYIAKKDEWWSFAARRDKLKKITTFIEGVASGLRDLDIVSRDDLACRVGAEKIDELAGSLQRLGVEAASLLRQVQTNGRPRDLAEERWILELADIYENAFYQPASVWGIGGGPVRRRGGFYLFLELSRPEQFPMHGKLHPRQVDRLLKRRRQPRDS